MDFLFEQYRNTPNLERQTAIALELWDAGAHLITCESDPQSPRFKVPTFTNWQTHRASREAIENWVRVGRFIGIVAPATTLGISCVDIDNGAEYRTVAIDTLGAPPLVAHESSRTKTGKCHFWYYTPQSVSANKWAGGDIRSNSKHQVLLYNLDAIGAAWGIAKAGKAQPVDLSLLPAANNKHTDDALDGFDGMTDEEPIPEDAAIPTIHRHNTMMAKIGRAVNQCATKKELAGRMAVIANAHRKAMADETDATRKASVKTEIAGAIAFAEGAWAKKLAARKVEKEIWLAANAYTEKTAAWDAVSAIVDDFVKLCVQHNWPTSNSVIPQMRHSLDRAWQAKDERKRAMEQALAHQHAAVSRANEESAQTMSTGGTNIAFFVTAPPFSIDAYVQAAHEMGFRLRHNTFNEQGEIWIPKSFLQPKLGGGKWMPITEQRKAIITVNIAKYAKTGDPNDETDQNPVEVNHHKEVLARDFMFAANQWCPLRNYFETLPPWCGEHIIHNSMARGGMQVDAGEFTDAAQAFPWLFVVRNCLYPGSSMRESIVLFGDHDCGKSKFVELMLPPHLKRYYNGAFSLDGSLKVKLERSIGKALLECGEMGQGGAKDWAAVKQWLTLSEVNGERMAYAEFAKQHKLTATTIFSTNHPELPPLDDAVLSRFIWVKVLTPASRAQDEAGNDVELVWQHFNDLYDPNRPELGTWREQYFSQALAIVKGSERVTTFVEDGARQSIVECHPNWLPAGSKSKLVAWNKSAGATYTTDQSDMVDTMEMAIRLLAPIFGYGDDCIGFYPNSELRAAMYAINDDDKYCSWFDLLVSPPDAAIDRKMDRIRKVGSGKVLANAFRQVAKRMGHDARNSVSWWKEADKPSVRGWELIKKGAA